MMSKILFDKQAKEKKKRKMCVSVTIPLSTFEKELKM